MQQGKPLAYFNQRLKGKSLVEQVPPNMPARLLVARANQQLYQGAHDPNMCHLYDGLLFSRGWMHLGTLVPFQ